MLLSLAVVARNNSNMADGL